MKKFFTLLVSSLFSLSLLAYDGSRLSISTFTNSKMDLRVEVDGRKYEMRDNSIVLSNLSEGSHSVKIFREKKRNRGGFGSGRKQDLVYSTTVFLRRGFHHDITINRFGKAMVDERRIDRNDDWYEDEYEDDYDNGGWNSGYSNVMKPHEFESVKGSISKEWLESTRLSTTKFIIDKYHFTTQQVRELMMLFSFEKNKLEIAKYAYRKTVDKHNYHQVNDVLNFNSSKDELARFLRESR